MLNIPDICDCNIGNAEFEQAHYSKLVMHWIDECTDPRAHAVNARSTTVPSSASHRDRLVAVWMDSAPLQKTS